jgi:hypothetical protein
MPFTVETLSLNNQRMNRQAGWKLETKQNRNLKVKSEKIKSSERSKSSRKVKQ